jgi:hypothetical protein
MKKLVFKTDIHASKEKVWKTMLNPDTYREWVTVSWSGSYYQDSWKQGSNLKFISPAGGGTMANLVECKLYDFILANHIAVLNRDLSEDRTSDMAKGWVGSTESYAFSEHNNITTFVVEINTNPSWERMFSDGWPAALYKLKELCEY